MIHCIPKECRSHLIFTRDSRPALSTCKDEHLINSVDFISNVTSNRNLHRNQLAEQTGVKHFSELPKSSHFGGELGKVYHLVLGR